MPTLFCFGLGYTAHALCTHAQRQGWRTGGSRRAPHPGTVCFDGLQALPAPTETLAGVTHILHSTPPTDAHDAVLTLHGNDLAHLPNLQWVGYLSTTGVYGDWNGEWVDETSELRPSGQRQTNRARTEAQWLAWGAKHGVAVQIFRLAGIYGPGRNALEDVQAGDARRIDKPGQVFSRIHVEDIVQAVWAGMQRPLPGEVFNVCDNLPAPAPEVVAYACELLGITPPPLIPYATAELSPMARSFYSANRRVRNDKMKQLLGLTLRYPTYHEGLKALHEQSCDMAPSLHTSSP